MKEQNKEKNLLRFVFDEMNEKEASSFLSELCTDDQLWDTYEEVDDAIEAMKGAEMGPSEDSLNAVMDFVKKSNPNKEEPSRRKLSGPLNRFFEKINLHGALATAMLIFVLAGVAGSVYKIRRTQNLSPDRNNVSQKMEPVVNPDLQWEPTSIDAGLNDIRMGIENLMKDDKF